MKNLKLYSNGHSHRNIYYALLARVWHLEFIHLLRSTMASSVIPPANSDLHTTWAFLVEGIDHIMTKLHTGVTFSKVNQSYERAVYAPCDLTMLS